MVESPRSVLKQTGTMDELRDEVSRILLTLETSELISVCEHLKCSKPSGGFASKARRALIR